MAALHSTAGAVHLLLLLVVVAVFVAAAAAFWRGLIVPGIALAVLGVLAAVALL